MKTIIARFEDMKKDPMAILEDGVSANKVEAALATIGIALRDSEGEFRALQDVMDELGIKWNTLSRNQQAYIATVAAGSRQQSRFLALMNNYDRTLDLISESQNSAGAAAKQYATYQDSIAAAQARLTASWEKLYSKIVDNDLIKFVINGLSKILELLSEIPVSITAIGVAIGALRLQKFMTDKGGILGIIKDLLTNGTLKKVAENTGEEITESLASGILKNKGILTGSFTSISSGIKSALSSVISGLGAAKTAIIGFASAHPIATAAIAALVAVIGILIYNLEKERKEYQKNIEKIKEYQEEIDKLKTQSSNGKSLFKTYDELTRKISLTDEEQNQLNSTIEQIKEIYPEAITYLDQYGNMQLANAEYIREVIAAEQTLAGIRQRQVYEKRQTVLEGFYDTDFLGRQKGNKQSLIEAGFNSRSVEQWAASQEEVDYYKSLMEESHPGRAIGLFSGPVLYAFKDLESTKSINENIQALKESLELGMTSEIEAASAMVSQINNLIKEYNLRIAPLAEDASWKEVLKTVEKINDEQEQVDINYQRAIQSRDQAFSRMEKENNLDLTFSKLSFDISDSQILTAQSAIAAQLKTMFSQMDINIWEDFLEANGGIKGLADLIQEILNSVTEENGIEMLQLFKDLNAGKITAEEFYGQFEIIANESGSESAKNFIKGFSQQLEEQLNTEKENFENYFSNIGVQSSVRYETAENLEAGQGQLYQDYAENYLKNSSGRVMAYAATDLLKIPPEQLQQFENEVHKAESNGNAEALQEIQAKWLETWKDIDEDVAYLLIHGRILDAFHQFQVDYVSKIANAASDVITQKDYSSMDISEGINYYSAFDQKDGTNTFWDHATIDESGKLQLDYIGQVIAAQTDLNSKMEIYNRAIANAQAELETNTDLTDQEREELRRNILYWEEVVRKIGESNSKIGIIIESSKELNDIIINYSNNLGKAAKNAEALQVSSDAGKEYQEVIDALKEIENDMKTIGSVSRKNMDALTAHGDFYQDFFTIDNGAILFQLNEVVSNYANAADAVKAIARNRQQFELEIKKQELEAEAQKAEAQASAYEQLGQIFYDYASKVEAYEGKMTDVQRQELANQYNNQVTQAKEGLQNADNNYNALMQACEDTYAWMSSLDAAYWANLGNENIGEIVSSEIAARKAANAAANASVGDIIDKLVTGGSPEDLRKQGDEYKKMAASLRSYAESLRSSMDRLQMIDPTIYEEMADKLDKAGKTGSEAMNKIGNAVKDLADALIKLDDILVDLKKNLSDINVDYNPFTDLFEAWEKEWDYYYNIKRLIAQIGTQGQYIDNIISSDYAIASQRLAAQQAKIGNLLAAMSANDTYIEALRAGMSQTAVELMEEFGEYYRVNPDSGQIYQHDTSLQEINDLINLRKQEVYQVQRLQNEKQNDLALENARLDALEEEKSAYEEILSTVEDQIEDLKNNEDITADISELKNVQAELKAKIIVSDDSIEEVKDRIKVIENEIEDIELDLTLKEDSLNKLEDYVSKMEDKVSEYEEYWENLNSTIAEQQELLESLTEIYQDYVNTAISTEQSLYNAIIENYQDEIDEKKKQYDYLKQLDKEYLDSVKDNISKEKQARKDSENQRNYQQSLQRAQLLQMDTSGAYRSELASLNKEIEKQRQDLYDDLVDKQVKALEEEINKRHELYDMEVAALEERLAYMQENAILLWEMINEIIVQGTENMMATLENTTDYINANELSKMNQRKEWEYNVLKTFDGVKNGTIDMLNELIKAGNDFIVDKYPEVGRSLDEYSEVFRDASRVVNEYSDQLGISTLTLNNNTRNGTEMFEKILQDFAEQWNYTTNLLTGYSNNWKNVTDSLKNQLEENITALKAMNNDGGSIKELDNTLRQAAKEMYQSFIEERNKYKNELDTLIKKIQTDISAAIQYASDAIRKAVDSIKAGNNSSPSGGGSDSGGNTSGGSGGGVTSGGGSSNGSSKEGEYTGWMAYFNINGSITRGGRGLGHKGTYAEIEADWMKYLNVLKEKNKGKSVTSWGLQYFAQGGLANFTGPAWLDGTSSNPERVLSPKQTKLFESMVSSLERASNNSDINSALGSSYNIGDINTTIQVDRLDDQTDINRLAKQVEDRIMRTIRNKVVVSVNKGV